ncbi:MAG: DUF998 domain-containing protein [Chitinophagales bacterium]
MNSSANKTNFARLAIACAAISLLALLSLHFVSPEFDPAWRMISEYALGTHKWLITMVFIFWAGSSFFIILLLWNMMSSMWAKVGLALICISFIGQIMGGIFDIKTKLHGFAFLLGVPSVPIGALLVSYHLVSKDNWKKYKSRILFSAHSTWISLVFMAITMVLMISGFQKAGIPMGPDAEPPKTLPDGVIGLNGYANRILVICYIYWLIVVARTYLKIEKKGDSINSSAK